MDPSHGHQSRTSLRSLPSEQFEAAPSTATPQTIPHTDSTRPSPPTPPTTPPPSSGYDLKASPPTPTSPSKRSSTELRPADAQNYPTKRLRVEPTRSTSSLPTCATVSPVHQPASTAFFTQPIDRPLVVTRHRSTSLPPLRNHKKRTQNYLEPPVTQQTLRELDLQEIYRNPKLRHDVVFDSQLHFRPNLDGSRGRRKREQSEQYWKEVLRDCTRLFENVREKRVMQHTAELRLPILFKTIREILVSLVPKNDRDEVMSALDPPLLMQQLQHGVLDFKKLARWLAAVLKAHCAPMRDQWVEQMVTRIAYGVDHGKTAAFVEGLKIIFGILEAMKLDVANHQIRTLRPHLVSTAVQFEQGYFHERIESGRLDIREAVAWFQNAASKADKNTDPYFVFSQAAVEMLTPTHYVQYPATFTFDFDRLDGIRDDIREATCLKVALMFFQGITHPSKRDIGQAALETLRGQLFAILSEEEGPYKWIKGSTAIALHLAKVAHEFNGNTGLVDGSSIKLAENWLGKHLRPESHIYKRIERSVIQEVTSIVVDTMKSWSSLCTSPILLAAEAHGCASLELPTIAQRISHIAFLHWRIFGHRYTASLTAKQSA
ncbi:Tcp11-domain-containing protein [Ascodesmis nigricans]|uniref:Tcp11-domain-containing protein n=1 Tax=Ascodesmis nigricans TaxID=341454 RepID=A0A4S2MV56_9PEZI|nr:Tcp11-domain-containing protein [Ascodesmis nigricans]